MSKSEWKKTKPVLIAITIYLACLIFDFATTIRLGYLVQYLETNPLYHFIGLTGLIATNCLIIIGLYIIYQYYDENLTAQYSIILIMMIISLLRIFIGINNITIGNNPPTTQEAQAITQEYKTQYYVWKIIIPAITAYIPGMIAFIIYRRRLQKCITK